MNDEFYMKVVNHHNIVQNRILKNGDIVLMTVAVGSQNYGLDTSKSDCDTFSFILPDFLSFIRSDAPDSYEFEAEDGKCMVKDLRLALNLLRKPSPNSVECWVSPYRVYNAKYKEVFDTFLDVEDNLFFMTHCDYLHMMDAIIGTIKNMKGRNMSTGKKTAHTMRLMDMFCRYLSENYKPSEYLELDGARLKIAREIKNSNFPEESYEFMRDSIINSLTAIKDKFEANPTIIATQETGKIIINNFQSSLMDVYLKENGYIKR